MDDWSYSGYFAAVMAFVASRQSRVANCIANDASTARTYLPMTRYSCHRFATPRAMAGMDNME